MGHNSREVLFFLGQELLLDFAAWIDLTSNADNMIMVSYLLPSKFQSISCFNSLKHADDLLPILVPRGCVLFGQNQESRPLWLAKCCKIQQLIIFIQQKYLFNFNPNYFHSTKIFIQLQPKIISLNNKVPGH